MNELNPRLVADLARLAARYSADDWAQLLAWFEDEEKRMRVVSLLHELASTSRARASRRGGPDQTSRPERIREAIARLRSAEPARADLLDEIWSKLRKRELLPDMRTVRAFTEAIGLKDLASTKRDQAVGELVERLMDMPPDSLEKMMRQTVIQDRELGAEYERWVRIILGPEPDNTIK